MIQLVKGYSILLPVRGHPMREEHRTRSSIGPPPPPSIPSRSLHPHMISPLPGIRWAGDAHGERARGGVRGMGSGSGGGMWEVEVGDGKEVGKEDRGRIIHAS